MKRPVDRWLVAVLGIIGVAYVVVAAQVLDRLDPLTGDEPFYVMTAISIVRDGDVDEANNYADLNYDEFYPDDPLPTDWNGWRSFPRTLPPHPATTDRVGLYTKHGLGLSAMIAVPYDVAGRVGAIGVIVVCALLVAANMYWLAREAGSEPPVAAILTVMLAVTMPIAPYAALIFPEIPAALALVYAVRRLAAPSNSALQWLGVGIALGLLPWLHQRFVPTVLVLVSYALVRLWRSRAHGAAVAALVPVALGGFSLIGYNFWLYGSPVQDTADHAGFNGLSGTLNASFGLLLDAQWGLLVAAPVYLLALVAMPGWVRASATARVALVALMPYLLVVATYRVWRGEWGPPARYLVPIAPFAAGALATWVVRSNVVGRGVVICLWGAGAILTLIGIVNPQRFYHHPDGVNNLVARLDGSLNTTLNDWLIAYQPYSSAPLHERVAAALVLLAALIVAATAFYVLPRLRSVEHEAGPDSHSSD